MIWDFQDALTRRLLLWSALSIAAGAALLVFGDAFWRGFGLQAVVWGAIDAAIAIFGRRSAERRLARYARTGGMTAETETREAAGLRRLLWINTGLDVLYVAGGLLLANTLGQTDEFARGNGWGIVVQGGFLFLFDLLHALTVPRPVPALDSGMRSRGPSTGRSTCQAARGRAAPPWLPRQPRRDARAGQGAQRTGLDRRGAAAAGLWQRHPDAHRPALAGVDGRGRCRGSHASREGHEPVLFVGYSMGAALSLISAQPAAGLALLAPFSFPEPWWLRPAEFFVRPFLPLGFRPLRRADFANPQLRHGIGNFMPDLDLDDPGVQGMLRDFRVPLGLIDQLRGVSRNAVAAAPGVNVPVLIVQGARDQVSRPAYTKRLIAKLPEAPAYVEVDSDHNVTDVSNPAWPAVREAVLDFAARVAASPR